MKIYLISNVPSGGDALIDTFDAANVNVVAKEVRGGIGKIEEEIASRVNGGNIDMLLFVTDDAIGANMALNKYQGVKAATCVDAQDVSSAYDNGANVIILSVDKADREGIAQALVRGGKGIGKIMQIRKPIQRVERPAPRMERPITAQKTDRPMPKYDDVPSKPFEISIKLPKFSLAMPKKKAKVEGQEEDEDVKYPAGKPREGVVGKIKDALGILD